MKLSLGCAAIMPERVLCNNFIVIQASYPEK